MTDKLGAKAIFGRTNLTRPVQGASPAHIGGHLDFLDSCRGAAIIFVFLSHCPPNLAPNRLILSPWEFISSVLFEKNGLSHPALWPLFALSQLGEFGVAIFFVVSGFCIYQSYTQTNRPEPRAFFLRRFFRIYPPYLLTLLILALVYPPTRLPFNKLSDWLQIVVHLLMCHNLSNAFVFSINPVYWSLAVEIQLYVLFPLSLIWVRRLSYHRVLLLLAAIEVTTRCLALFGFAIPGRLAPAWASLWPWSFWFSWSTGAAIADAYFNRKPLPFVGIHPLVWLGAGLTDCLMLSGQFSFMFFALFTASLISRSLRSPRSEGKGTLIQNFLRRTGVYSYSVYLIHVPILLGILVLCEALMPQIVTHPFLISFAKATGWLMIFPLAALIYYYVEKPSIALGKWVIHALRQRGTIGREADEVI